MKAALADTLKPFARKYIWWKSPDEAVATPERVLAQVMDVGDYSDVQLLVEKVGEDALRKTLLKAEPGQFRERSWHYWHYRLGMADVEQVPVLLTRQFE